MVWTEATAQPYHCARGPPTYHCARGPPTDLWRRCERHWAEPWSERFKPSRHWLDWRLALAQGLTTVHPRLNSAGAGSSAGRRDRRDAHGNACLIRRYHTSCAALLRRACCCCRDGRPSSGCGRAATSGPSCRRRTAAGRRAAAVTDVTSATSAGMAAAHSWCSLVGARRSSTPEAPDLVPVKRVHQAPQPVLELASER